MGSYACAVLDDGSVHCWGGGGFKRDIFGDGSKETARRPVEVPELSGAQTITIGRHGTQLCSLGKTGAVRCKHGWGTFPSGPLLDDATSLALGVYHACASTKSGRVVCWGKAGHGALGDGSTAAVKFRAKPKVVAGLKDIVGVRAGFDRSCAWSRQGEAWCWGLWQTKPTVDAGLPVAAPLYAGVEQMVSSKNQDCALRGDGQVRCGIGTRIISRRTVGGRLLDGTGVKDVLDLAVSNAMVCAATKSGTVYCWGSGKHGRLGDGRDYRKLLEKPFRLQAPRQLRALKNVVDVETTGLHTCARTRVGEVWCWGRNVDGELGDGSVGGPKVPVRVLGISDARQLALGNRFTCALRSDHSVWCWGKSSWGETGSGRDSERELTPVRVLLPR